jgi:mannosyl-oligosaccharide alpha-1,2-mannosidase
MDHAKSREKYPLSTYMALPSGSPATIPPIQFSFSREDAEVSQVQVRRLAAVEEAFIHSWNGYKKYGWLKDELAPLTGGYRNTFGGWAVTLVDSLDTLWIMGLEKEFYEAVNAAATIDFRTPASLPINVFETTIRLLGGFLGAYDVSGGTYPILLEKAREIGEVGSQLYPSPRQ